MKPIAVTMQYILTPTELKMLQAVLLEILSEVDRICKKNNIKYNIFAGTLLGAVRHKGFIPWDDDIDIAISRNEYIKFRDVCHNDLDKKRFFFQDHTTDPHYPWGYGRIRYKNTEFTRVGQEHLKMQTGIFLDIFPLDTVPNNKLLRGLHCFYCFVLRKLLYAESGIVNGKNAFQRGIYKIMNLIPRRFTFYLLDKLAIKNKDKQTKYVRLLTFPLPKNRIYGMERVWFYELADIQFEGKLFPGTKNWEEFLTYYYGDDFMQLPPVEKRHWHPVSKFSLPKNILKEDINE
jgi:lipopolysaccharide cholinephosphotransferase